MMMKIRCENNDAIFFYNLRDIEFNYLKKKKKLATSVHILISTNVN